MALLCGAVSPLAPVIQSNTYPAVLFPSNSESLEPTSYSTTFLNKTFHWASFLDIRDQYFPLGSSSDPSSNTTCWDSPNCNSASRTGREISSTSCDFYLRDVEDRFKCGEAGYPLSFGYKYCQLFLHAEGGGSATLKEWSRNVRVCLQQRLADMLDDTPQDISCHKIFTVALASHTECYLAPPSYCDLSMEDRLTVIRLVGMSLCSSYFLPILQQAGAVLFTCAKSDIRYTAQLVNQNVGTLFEDVYSVVKRGITVIQLDLPTMEVLLGGLASLYATGFRVGRLLCEVALDVVHTLNENQGHLPPSTLVHCKSCEVSPSAQSSTWTPNII